MQKQSLKKQTILLSATNIFVRILGFSMRIIFSRLMGSEALGVMELASSAHMLAITPVTAGIPLAVSRLTAKEGEADSKAILSSGLHLITKIALALMLFFTVFSVPLARLLGDERTFPSILVCVPAIFILGRAAVYNGYCYGRSNATLPALSELVEQIVRFLLSLALLFTFSQLALPWLAAIPMFAVTVAEAAGLCLITLLLKPYPLPASKKQIEQKLFALALPPTLMRLSNTLLRTLNAILIPLRLRLSGLSAAEATGRFGLFSGMLLPVLFLPSVVTSALAMVSSGRMARFENRPRQLKADALKMLLFAAATGGVCAIGLHLFAPFISIRLYRQADLAALIKFCCPSVFFLSINQVTNGMIAGVGRQKHALYGNIVSALVTVAINFFLTAQPAYRIYGAAIGMMSGQFISTVWNLSLLRSALLKANRRDGISA